MGPELGMDQVDQRIEGARRLLYDLDPVAGTILGKSNLYKLYEANATAYATAKSTFASAMEKAASDPARASQWPLIAVTYQQAVDTAYDAWMSAGKREVEGALAIMESTGTNRR